MYVCVCVEPTLKAIIPAVARDQRNACDLVYCSQFKLLFTVCAYCCYFVSVFFFFFVLFYSSFVFLQSPLCNVAVSPMKIASQRSCKELVPKPEPQVELLPKAIAVGCCCCCCIVLAVVAITLCLLSSFNSLLSLIQFVAAVAFVVVVCARTLSLPGIDLNLGHSNVSRCNCSFRGIFVV